MNRCLRRRAAVFNLIGHRLEGDPFGSRRPFGRLRCRPRGIACGQQREVPVRRPAGERLLRAGNRRGCARGNCATVLPKGFAPAPEWVPRRRAGLPADRAGAGIRRGQRSDSNCPRSGAKPPPASRRLYSCLTPGQITAVDANAADRNALALAPGREADDLGDGHRDVVGVDKCGRMPGTRACARHEVLALPVVRSLSALEPCLEE